MKAEDVKAFVARDWALVAEAKARYWSEAGLTPEEGLLVADDLRRQVLIDRPDWPDDQARAEDLEHHVQVAELLRRAAAARGR